MRRTTRNWVRHAAVLLSAVLGVGATNSIVSADANPPFIPPDASWLTTVNYYRAMSNLAPVSENPTFSAGAYNHSCYMLQNGISHDEIPGLPGYTDSGDIAGNSGNVAVSSVYGIEARQHIELWMTGPFHTVGVLRPNLQTVGFGQCDNTATSPWRSAATLDVLRGLSGPSNQTEPILFPGNGMTTNLSQFITESPNPLTFCGWTGAAGLPVLALMPEALTGNAAAAIRGAASGQLDVCVLTQFNTTGVASQILAANNVVVVIPRARLASDTYSVALFTPNRAVNWSFTVDPTAASGVQPLPTTTAVGDSGGLQPVAPTRVVDTRLNLGTSHIYAGQQRRIQITGRGGVPAGAEAISANFTVAGPDAGGYLSVWNCSDRPTVSTLNYGVGQVVPNGASVPLDATGGICVFSSAGTDLIVDVNGYYASTASGRLASVTPTRLMDTRVPQGAPGRLMAGSTTPLRVTGVAGIPVGASAVMLNVTSIFPDNPGFVTVYPCDADRPTVSSLNPVPYTVKPNNVVAPVSKDGTVCLYVSTNVDLLVDVTGYVKAAATLMFTPSAPFRLVDTRDRFRPEMNAGTGGQPILTGHTVVVQVAGNRGIASNAKAVSANFTVVGAATAGFLTVWQCGARPTTSNVNFEAGAAIANGAQLPLSAAGQLCVFVSTDANVIIDVNGWWS
ncbi:unannotated protein [freshwater metagenome]|uniref:Unannotated protein n=1 Tax=freshwater metagenome TaxID=449393 RepID=A0A6J7ES96_9ZZZZ|nr:hypothetical protein [Actinomycetota bacterium]